MTKLLEEIEQKIAATESRETSLAIEPPAAMPVDFGHQGESEKRAPSVEALRNLVGKQKDVVAAVHVFIHGIVEDRKLETATVLRFCRDVAPKLAAAEAAERRFVG